MAKASEKEKKVGQMNTKPQWFLIETEKEYDDALARYEIIKYSESEEDEKEMMLLVYLIEKYENSLWDLPEVDPVEMIKIRMEDFGFKAAGLATVHGDKGTVSKVLNYKQPPVPDNDKEIQSTFTVTRRCIDKRIPAKNYILIHPQRG